jgi:hypothetical protein
MSNNARIFIFPLPLVPERANPNSFWQVFWLSPVRSAFPSLAAGAPSERRRAALSGDLETDPEWGSQLQVQPRYFTGFPCIGAAVPPPDYQNRGKDRKK